MRFKVVLEPSDEGGFTIHVPSLPGCISEGETVEEAMRDIQKAIELYLEPGNSVCCLSLQNHKRHIMKLSNLLTVALTWCMLLAANRAASQTATGIKRYQIRSSVVEYTLSGAQKGTETIYFDNWGMREAKYTKAELSVAGFSQKQNTLTLLDGGYTYNIDLDKRTGTKMETPLLKELAAQSKDLTETGEKMMKSMGGEKIGTEVILGKTCDVWEIKNMRSKVWVWKGVTLKTQVTMPNMEMTIMATKIDEGASIAPDKFAIPTDVKISEAEDMKKMLEGLRTRKKN